MQDQIDTNDGANIDTKTDHTAKCNKRHSYLGLKAPRPRVNMDKKRLMEIIDILCDELDFIIKQSMKDSRTTGKFWRPECSLCCCEKHPSKIKTCNMLFDVNALIMCLVANGIISDNEDKFNNFIGINSEGHAIKYYFLKKTKGVADEKIFRGKDIDWVINKCREIDNNANMFYCEKRYDFSM